MKNTNWLKEMSWTEFDERRKTCDTVIIPGGAIEVYGPHMPLGSDSIVSEAICELVAEQTNAIIGPMIEVGDSAPLGLFPGTIIIKPSSYAAITRDILDSLINWGFKNFMFINMHAGNVPIISSIARDYQREKGIKCAQIDWWRFTQPNSTEICENTGWMAHGHASECGTSVMLHLHPEYVDFDQAECIKQDSKYTRYPDIIKYDEFGDKTPNGILGDATLATKEKGKAIVENCVDRIVEFMKEEFNC